MDLMVTTSKVFSVPLGGAIRWVIWTGLTVAFTAPMAPIQMAIFAQQFRATPRTGFPGKVWANKAPGREVWVSLLAVWMTRVGSL